MYKVFVNDCSIILTDTKKISTELEIKKFERNTISQIVESIFKGELKGVCLYCTNLEVCWQQFMSKFKIQKAAGGKVLNSKKEVLFIYRLGKWDLPKGKLEKGESLKNCAIREVEEECGISNLHIEKQLETTYHIFERNGKTILKITYWFLMKSGFTGKLIPQTEEDIEIAVFKNNIGVKEALQNTYENIKLLF
ncbi:MAG: NUDIX domain-containing protein [Lutibacter sp.]|uniref:NUDIX hydrolase n=1 Tax=Lutibacter sp. TaxID=1925666 RepID=UPI003858007A